MATQTKEIKAVGKHLSNVHKRYQASLDDKLKEVQEIIADSLKNGGITEDTMESLSGIFRGYEYIKPIADNAWERYYDHCEKHGLDLQQ
jgi:hypothetical protein